MFPQYLAPGERVAAEQPYRLITVRNERGEELAMYEYWLARTFFGLVAERRLKLSSGEQVVPIDDGSFMIALTGERLTRIAPPSAPSAFHRTKESSRS